MSSFLTIKVIQTQIVKLEGLLMFFLSYTFANKLSKSINLSSYCCYTKAANKIVYSKICD